MKILLSTIAIFLLHFVHPVFCRLADVDHWLHPDSTGEIQSCLSPELADQERDTCRFFAIVIDAGSTGTRLHLYEFSHDPNSDSTPFHVEKETFREVKPGLSSFAEDPEGAARSVGDLLSHAENTIPKSLWRHTPITMKATAGLRLLSKELAEAILEHVQYRISLTEFLLDEQDAVGVLSGTDEGVFGWFTLNVLLQRMNGILPHQSNCQQRIIKDIEMPGIIPHPSNCQQRIIKDIEMNDRTTAAALDLGGGSTQITFMPTEPQITFNGIPMEDFTHNISLFGHLVHLYTHSYLGNGLIAARLAIAKRDSVSITLLHTVCMPEDFIIETWDYAGILWTVRGSREYGLNGCLEAAIEFVHKSQVRAVEELDDTSIYAFSYFFDRGLQAGLVKNNLGGLTTIEAFRNAAERACSQPSGALSGEHWRPWQCFDLCYIIALLNSGYGIHEHKPIFLAKRIRNMEVSWALGASYHLLNSYRHHDGVVRTPSIFPSSKKSNESFVDEVVSYIASSAATVLSYLNLIS